MPFWGGKTAKQIQEEKTESVHWGEDDKVNKNWNEEFRVLREVNDVTENSLLLSFLPSLIYPSHSLSHIVVLIGILLIPFHVVPVNKWLYPLL